MYFPNNRYFSLKEEHTHVYIKETMRSPPTYTHPFSTPLTGECSIKVMTIPVVSSLGKCMQANTHAHSTSDVCLTCSGHWEVLCIKFP